MQTQEHCCDPRVVNLTDDAAATFEVWWTQQPKTFENVPQRMKGHLGKYPGYVLRLALVLQHLWWCVDDPSPKPTTISKAAVLAAIRLVDEYFRPMAERVYGDAETPEIERHEATLANWIIKNKPDVINARVLRREDRLPGLRDAKLVDAVLEALVDAGWLVATPERAGDTSGRKRKDFVVDQRVYRAVN